MIEVPFIMGGSWIDSKERRVRHLFHLAIVVKEVDEWTQDIATRLSNHYTGNEGFSVKIFVDNGKGLKDIGAEGANLVLYLVNKDTCQIGMFGVCYGDGTKFDAIDEHIGLSFRSFVMDLAVKQVCGD